MAHDDSASQSIRAGSVKFCRFSDVSNVKFDVGDQGAGFYEEFTHLVFAVFEGALHKVISAGVCHRCLHCHLCSSTGVQVPRLTLDTFDKRVHVNGQS